MEHAPNNLRNSVEEIRKTFNGSFRATIDSFDESTPRHSSDYVEPFIPREPIRNAGELLACFVASRAVLIVTDMDAAA